MDPPRQIPHRLTKRAVTLVAVVAVAAGGIGYAVYASTTSNPCAGVQVPTASVTAAKLPTAAVVAGPESLSGTHADASGRLIQVVAAENFWGSLVAQLGGNRTSVTSIITDPNTDPHEYEGNTTVSREIANANYIIVNGVGYDDWAISEIQADGETNQTVLNVGVLNGVSVGGGIVSGNPHMWYNPVYVNRTVAAMYADLAAISPSNASYFQAQYTALNVSLGALYQQANEIRHYHAGAVVASTESILVYLANYTGLDLISPPAFMEAVAEGNDPPTQSVVTFQCQLESGKVAVLVYNEQTVTPITTNLKVIAAEHNVSVVGVTETIQPPTDTFQQWMGAEYQYLQNALNATALGA